MRSPIACFILVLAMLCSPSTWSQVSISVDIAPPPLLMYAQPPVPGEGFIWVPGYWVWSDPDRGYYWVPGTWVLAPNIGDLWTPGYWAFEGAGYFWHIGYWGPQVGFYGGINYGYGYFGTGYQGGRWDRGAFRYNRAVSNVNAQMIHNVYSAPAANFRSANRVSFNGGRMGAMARPTASERQFQAAGHTAPSADQVQHEAAARGIPTQRANGTRGVPQIAATPRPSEFSAPGIERVRGEPGGRQERADVIRGAPASTPGPAPVLQRLERQAAPQTPPEALPAARPEQRAEPRQEVLQAPRIQQPRPEQQAPAGHAEQARQEQRAPGGRGQQPQQEAEPRRER